MSDNKNNEDKKDLDLSNDSLEINLDDLNSDIEISFDDLDEAIDVVPVDENQPIENISLMSENAPREDKSVSDKEQTEEISLSEPVPEEPITEELSLSDPVPEEPITDELSLSDPVPEEPKPVEQSSQDDVTDDSSSLDFSLSDPTPEEQSVSNESNTGNSDSKVEDTKDSENTTAEPELEFKLEDRNEDNVKVEASPQDDDTPIASTSPDSDPLGMDWQEPFDSTSSGNSNGVTSTPGAKFADMNKSSDSSSSDNDVSINIADKPKKKKKKAPVIIGSIVAVLAIIAGVGFYLIKINPVTSNTIMSTILKPNSYYQMVESNNVKNFISTSGEKIGNTVSMIKDKANEAVSSNTTITLSEGLTSLSSLLGPYGSILTSVKTVSVNSDVITQDKKTSCILELGLNDNSIVTVNVVLDQDNNALYLQCPSVLKRWIKVPINTSGKNIDFSKGKKITGEDVKTILNTYLPILITNFEDVKLNKNKVITVDTSKVTVSEIVINISKENSDKIGKKLVEQLKKDELIFSYLKSYGVFKTKDEYAKAVASLNSKSTDTNDDTSEDSNEDTKVENKPTVMTVYVDKKGTIIGRDFSCDKEIVGYKYYDSGKVSKLAFKSESDTAKLNIEGNINDNNKTYSGETAIKFEYTPVKVNTDVNIDFGSDNNDSTDGSSTESTNAFTFNLKYDNIKLINEKKGLFKGNFSLSADGIKYLTGASLDLKYSVQNNKQASEIIVNYQNQPLVSIASTEDTSKQSSITVPTSFIEQDKLTSDYLTQYNVLLELDTYTPVVTLMKSLNNQMFKQVVAAYYVQPGYRFLNGSQNAKHLIYIARKTNNTQLYKLAMYGYKMTAAGKNPGLDATN